MNSISKTKRLNFSWYLLKTLNRFSFKRCLLPWASTKCRPLAEYLCSAMRWWRCRAVYPTQCASHGLLEKRSTTHCRFTIDGLIFMGLRSYLNFLLTKTGCNVGRILWLRSRNCFRTASAVTWSLNVKVILAVLPSSVFLSAVPAEAFVK